MKLDLRSSLACAALAATALIAGCGGGSSKTVDQGAATIAPANASFYIDAKLKPQGASKQNLDSFLSAVLATNDPGQKLADLISKSAKSNGKGFDFNADVKPWLGDTAGGFAIGFAKNAPGAFAVKATDPAKGVAFVRSQAKSATPRAYNGVSYQVDEKGQAFGAIGDFVVGGDEAAFKAAVDASKGNSLADSNQFKGAVADAPSDALGRGYLDLKQLEGYVAAQQGAPSSTVEQVASKLGVSDSLVVSASAAGPKTVGLDVRGLGALGGAPPSLISKLPADSTFAFGVSNLGGGLKGLLDKIESAGIPGLPKGAISAGISLQAGIDLQSVLPWMGDAAVFIRGNHPTNVDGALVIQSKDDTAAAKTMQSLRLLVQKTGRRTPGPLKLGTGGNGFTLTDRRFPQPLNFVQQNGLFVIGVGQAATQEALTPGKTLASSPEFKASTAALGGNAAFYASSAGLLSLFQRGPKVTAARLAQAKTYLDRLSFLAAGGQNGALRIVLGAK